MTHSNPPEVPGYSLVMALSQSSATRVDLVVEQASGEERVIKYVRGSVSAREMESLGFLIASEHPHLVRLIELGELDGWIYMVMEYVSGRSLKHLRFEWSLSQTLSQTLSRFRPLADALTMAASQSCFEANPCPENLIFVPPDRLVLIGFDPCTQLPADTEILSQEMIYWSPERLASKPLDERSYVYSLGMLLYVVLTGQLPRLQTLAELRAWQEENSPPLLPPHLTDFQPLLDRSLKQEPQERFASVDQFAEALENLSESAVEKAVAGAEKALLTTSNEPSLSSQGRLFGHQLPITLQLETISARAGEDQAEETDSLIAANPQESQLPPVISPSRSTIWRLSLGVMLLALLGVLLFVLWIPQAPVPTNDQPQVQQQAEDEVISVPPGLIEEAEQLEPLALSNPEALRHLVVIYRAALRGDDLQEQVFAQLGMENLQLQLAEQLFIHAAKRNEEEIRELRDQIAVLFDEEELLPELTEALAASQLPEF